MKMPLQNIQKRKEEFIMAIINFVYEELLLWKKQLRQNNLNEKKLNENLSKYLSIKAHQRDMLFSFQHEASQEGESTVDICAYLESNIDNITVFECKRLPIPKPTSRKDEYVTGHKDITGGIQRFKLCKHGKDHAIVGMIGYVENGTFDNHQSEINECISKLAGTTDENNAYWNYDENLKKIDLNNDKAKYKSVHDRLDADRIQIYHLWINMQK